MRAAPIASLPLTFAVLASFLGSLLLFAFEPYIGKILLPSFGGTPLLWNTCVVFFQVALLIGYLYALALTRYVPVGVQLAIQLVVLGSLFLLYPAARQAPGAMGDVNPGLVLAGWLSRYVLLPFVALSALTTLVQSWFAQSSSPWRSNPYRLYAASNAGSLAGLFAYPFLLEPNLSLGQQRTVLLFLLAAVMVTFTGLGAVVQRGGALAAPITSEAREAGRAPVARRIWLQIIGLTAIPASLLLGVTNYVLTDIASVPLFWIVPLALYLTTFILAFARRQYGNQALIRRVFTLLALAVVVSLAAETTAPASVLIPVHLITVFIASFLCHLKVASLAPHPRWLPHYYLAIALGGALGGMITLLVPPLVTDGFIEYPAAIVLATLVLPGSSVRRTARETILDVALPIVLVVASALLLQRFLPALAERFGAAAYLPAAMFVLNGNTRPRVFTVRLASLLMASFLVPSPFGRTLFAERNFYGRVRVTVDLSGQFHRVVHGSTVHGSQQISEMERCLPTAYYHPSGPAGQFLTLAPAAPRRVALVGLGSGALACYARPGEVWDLYELNPVMARVAQERSLFTFLERSPATKNFILGDARLSIEQTNEPNYDVIIVDAFSSDAIPIHLITQEAIATYVRRLKPGGGALLFHVSNRFFDLRPVLASVAPQVRMAAFVFADSVLHPNDAATGKYASEWVILTDVMRGATLPPKWVRLEPSTMRVWTDEYSNPLAALKALWTR